MIIAWMCAAVVFAACVSAAAYGTARLAQWANRPTRHVWSAALAVAVCWPLLVPVLRAVPWLRGSASAGVPAVATSGTSVPMVAPVALSPVQQWIEQVLTVLAPFAWLALAAWAVASALLVTRLLLAAFRLRQLTRGATPAEVDGEPVLLAEWLGPASVGWREPRVVLPRWVLTLDAPLRAMVLRHEREHCRTGDPRVVWYAAIATALVPWNPAVWWLARRLRLALELDCDVRTIAHTLARGGDVHGFVRGYAKLLLFMSQQHAVPTARTTLALSLSRSPSQLSQRIRAMQEHTQSQMPSQMPSHRRTAARVGRFALAAASVMAMVAACNTDIPGTVTVPEEAVSINESAEPNASVNVEPNVEPNAALPTLTEVQLDRPAYQHSAAMKYPPMLRSAQVEGGVEASFVVEADGTVDMSTFEVIRSDHELFTASVRQALRTATFTPAQQNGKAVRSRVTQPFGFALGARSVEKVSEPGGTVRVISEVQAGLSKPKAAPAPGEPYFEFQVDKPASMVPGTNRMTYPATLREAGVEGVVLASFVLNTNGTADMSTFRILRTDHPLFTESVRAALPNIQYTAGQVGGQAVRQVVQQPFVFRLAK